MRYYLAYGMNTNLGSMKNRCPAAISHGKVTLKNHKLAFKGVCDIIKTHGQDMECVLWTITEACEKSLDALEGYPYMYDKKIVQVEHEGKQIHAMIYYMVNSSHLSLPGESYLRLVAEGYREHCVDEHQIPIALKEAIEQKENNNAYNFRVRSRGKAKRKLHRSRVRNFRPW